MRIFICPAICRAHAATDAANSRDDTCAASGAAASLVAMVVEGGIGWLLLASDSSITSASVENKFILS